MKVKWLGHSCFLITSEGGTRIITDPYGPMWGISYGGIQESADIVTISHNHADHNNAGAVQGSPEIIREAGSGEVRGITVKGITTSHGFLRGLNLVFTFTDDGVKLCHLGDLAHLLSQQQRDAIGEVDVLFIPVGGLFTMGASKAWRVCEQLRPRIVFPMHYRNSRCRLPFASVDRFLKGREGCRRLEASEVEIGQASLPQTMEVWVLNPAR